MLVAAWVEAGFDPAKAISDASISAQFFTAPPGCSGPRQPVVQI
jgi:hypothetical protein